MSRSPLVPRLVSVPDDLEAVTTRPLTREADPVDAGMTRAGVETIWGAVEALYRSRTQPAVAFCMRRGGHVVLDRTIGYARGGGPDEPADAPKRLATPDTPFCIFSASKAVTAVVMHMLDERDLLRLGDPVAEYIPEFGRHGKRWVTIRHVLTHRAGIPSIAGDHGLEILHDWDRIVQLLCDAKPVWAPGRRLAYHAVTGGFILGEIVRRVTGRPVEQFLREELSEPLGCAHLTYGVTPERTAEVATNHFTGLPIPFPISEFIRRALGLSFHDAIATSNSPEFLTSVVPSGNVVATADDLCRFFQMLLDDGEMNGRRIMGHRTIRRLRVESSYLELDLTLALPIRYAQGLQLGTKYLSLFGPDTRKAFGHYGFVNIVGWADPERDVSAALLTSGKPILAGHLARFYDVLRQVSRNAPKVIRSRAA